MLETLKKPKAREVSHSMFNVFPSVEELEKPNRSVYSIEDSMNSKEMVDGAIEVKPRVIPQKHVKKKSSGVVLNEFSSINSVINISSEADRNKKFSEYINGIDESKLNSFLTVFYQKLVISLEEISKQFDSVEIHKYSMFLQIIYKQHPNKIDDLIEYYSRVSKWVYPQKNPTVGSSFDSKQIDKTGFVIAPFFSFLVSLPELFAKYGLEWLSNTVNYLSCDSPVYEAPRLLEGFIHICKPVFPQHHERISEEISKIKQFLESPKSQPYSARIISRLKSEIGSIK